MLPHDWLDEAAVGPSTIAEATGPIQVPVTNTMYGANPPATGRDQGNSATLGDEEGNTIMQRSQYDSPLWRWWQKSQIIRNSPFSRTLWRFFDLRALRNTTEINTVLCTISIRCQVNYEMGSAWIYLWGDKDTYTSVIRKSLYDAVLSSSHKSLMLKHKLPYRKQFIYKAAIFQPSFISPEKTWWLQHCHRGFQCTSTM